MNKEIKQILKNQLSIMNTVNYIMVNTQANGSGDLQRDIIESYEQTKELLNPKEKPTISEKTKQALSDKEQKQSEVKDD